MSSAEFQRAVKRLQVKRDEIVSWIRRQFGSLLRYSSLKGIVLSDHNRPLEGVTVTLNRSRSCVTDSEGAFSFVWIGSPTINLTFQWGRAELIDWISVEKTGRTTELKLKLPRLIRGQLINQLHEPLPMIKVKLNEAYETITDVQGCFFFPRQEGEAVPFERFAFEIDDKIYLHHFKLELREDRLYRFLYDESTLYHVDEVPQASPHAEYIQAITSRHRWFNTLLVVFLVWCLISAYNSNYSHFLSNELPQDDARKTTEVTSKVDDSILTGDNAHEAEPPKSSVVNLNQTSSCDSVEFLVSRYVVPKGMEGMLLSHLFGQWQNWEEIELANKLNEMELQAGMRLKFKLPIFPWRLITSPTKRGLSSIMESLECDDSEYCADLLQVWNPQLNVKYLQKGDILLVNPVLLQEKPFGQAELKKLEKIKRSQRRFRRRRPYLKLPSGCSLSTLVVK